MKENLGPLIKQITDVLIVSIWTYMYFFLSFDREKSSASMSDWTMCSWNTEHPSSDVFDVWCDVWFPDVMKAVHDSKAIGDVAKKVSTSVKNLAAKIWTEPGQEETVSHQGQETEILN